MIPDYTVNYHVYDLRAQKGLSLKDLSELSGLSKSHINDIENGNKSPTVNTLCRLSLALDVSPHDLFDIIVRNRSL